jgi:hypothetical protein
MKYHLTTTLARLKAADLCAEGYRKLVKSLPPNFDKDAPINLLSILESNGAKDLGWCLNARVTIQDSAPAWAEYQRVRNPALANFERVKAPAWAEYELVKATAWAEYELVRKTAWAEYQRVRKTALANFERVMYTAWAEYGLVKAPALASILMTEEDASLAATE